MSIVAELVNILDAAQRSVASHKRCIKDLIMLCKKSSSDEVLGEHLPGFLNKILIIYKHEPVVDRVINFIARFSAHPEADELTVNGLPFYAFLVRHALSLSNASSRGRQKEEYGKAVRLRSCQLIAAVMSAQPVDREIDEGLYRKIQKFMIVRLNDKDHKIRAQAVEALSRVQDTEDPNDPAVVAISRSIETDPSKDVRLAATKHLVITRQTLPLLLARCRDATTEVRKAALERVGKLNIKAISVTKRWDLIRNGLREREPGPREACSKICRSWLESFQSDIVQLLQQLHVAKGGEEAASIMLKHFLEIGVIKPEFKPAELTKESALTNELALQWRVICEFLHEKKKEHKLDEVLPDDSHFVHLVQTHAQPDGTFVLKQLLLIANYKEFVYQEAKSALISILCDVLTKPIIEHDMVSNIMPILKTLTNNEDDFVRLVLEHMSDLREELAKFSTPEAQEALAQQAEAFDNLVHSLKKKETQLLRCMGKNEDEETRLKQEIEAIKGELEAIKERESSFEWVGMRYLTVVETLMQQLTKASEEMITPLFQAAADVLRFGYTVPASVRAVAMRCVVLPALLGFDAAKRCGVLFYQAIKMDEEVVKESALKCLFDLVAVFGFESVQKTMPEDYEDLAVTMARCFHVPELVTVATEGFAKLFFTDKLKDPEILAELILVMFDPSNYQNEKLQQCMSVFINNYPRTSTEHKLTLVDATLTALRTAFYAPSDVPLSKADHDLMITTFVTLTNPNDYLPGVKPSVGTRSPHNALAVLLTTEWLTDPNGKGTKLLVKHLPQLILDKADQQSIRSLTLLIPKIEEVSSKVKTMKKFTDKFIQNIRAASTSAEVELTDEVQEQLDAKLEEFASAKLEMINDIKKTFKNIKSLQMEALATSDGEDDDEQSEDDFEEQPTNRGRKPTRNTATKNSKRKPKNDLVDLSSDSSSESEHEEESKESYEHEEESSSTSKRRPTRNARKVIQESLILSDEDDIEVSADEEAESDDGEFTVVSEESEDSDLEEESYSQRRRGIRNAAPNKRRGAPQPKKKMAKELLSDSDIEDSNSEMDISIETKKRKRDGYTDDASCSEEKHSPPKRARTPVKGMETPVKSASAQVHSHLSPPAIASTLPRRFLVDSIESDDSESESENNVSHAAPPANHTNKGVPQAAQQRAGVSKPQKVLPVSTTTSRPTAPPAKAKSGAAKLPHTQQTASKPVVPRVAQLATKVGSAASTVSKPSTTTAKPVPPRTKAVMSTKSNVMTKQEKIKETKRLKEQMRALVLDDEDDELEVKENIVSRLPTMTPNTKRIETQKHLQKMKQMIVDM